MTVDELLQRTVGQWQPSPLWVLRGKMFTWAEKLLVIAMLDMWHSAGQPEWWYASNALLMRISDLSKPTFLTARRRLVQKFFIQYHSGKQNHLASRYHLSQEFLHSLTNPTSLKTSTYSGGNVRDQLRVN